MFDNSRATLEQQFIGSLLDSPEAVSSLAWFEESFLAEPVHRRIYAEIYERTLAGEPVSVAALKPIFDNDPSLKDIGGGIYLTRLMAQFTPASPESMALELRDLHKRQELAAVCQAIAAECENLQGRDLEQIVAELASNAVSMLDVSKKKIKREHEVIAEIIDDLKHQPDLCSTGLKWLDEAMGGGLHAGKAYGFAARKKVGKTSLAGTISYNLSLANIPHLFICGEMGDKEIQQRISARATDSYTSAFTGEYGRSTDFSRKITQNWAEAQKRRGVMFYNSPGITFNELRATLLMAVNKHKIKGFILDYWQLVGGKPKGKSTSEHLDEVAQWVAEFGRRYGVWSITMAQINQEGNTRGGEGIRLAFDQVYQLHREDVTMPDAWIEMMDTRYTKWMNIGSKDAPCLVLMEKGSYFAEIS